MGFYEELEYKSRFLRVFYDLRSNGVLTDDEYNSVKHLILNHVEEKLPDFKADFNRVNVKDDLEGAHEVEEDL